MEGIEPHWTGNAKVSERGAALAGKIGRLAMVVLLTVILAATSVYGWSLNYSLLFAPSIGGYFLAAYLFARRSFHALVLLGYLVLIHELTWLGFTSISACCGGAGSVSDALIALLAAPPLLMIGYGLWRALPGRGRESTAQVVRERQAAGACSPVRR